MRIQIWSAALVALALSAPACSEKDLIGPRVPLAPSFTDVPGLPDVRISEFHYDDAGTDENEFIEVSLPVTTDLTGWLVVLYNGANGTPYNVSQLTGLVRAECGERAVVVLNYPVNGIQNGSPDGMALVNPSNHVVEFLSYEGSFTAAGTGPTEDNPAAGLTSTDIGASENGVPEGQSLSRSSFAANAWSSPAANTMGACNDDDEPPPPPPPVVIPETRFAEVHYDNVGGDGNEKIEIEGPAGTDLSGWSVVLYNGASPYTTTALSGVIAAQCDGRGTVVVSYPQDGIQNGSSDGFALVNGAGEVVEFLSYEGVIVASSGPAAGKTSTDIGVSEASSSPIGYSLQRASDGASWASAGPATFGLCNGATPPALSGVVNFFGRTAFDDPPLPVGFEAQVFVVERDPAADTVETTFTWSSDTPGIASVDQDGVLHALAGGTAILRATAADGTTGTYALPTRIATGIDPELYQGNAEFGEPTDSDPSDDFIIRHAQLTSSYSFRRNTPNWVAYEMEARHFGNELRCNCFTFDPALPASFERYTTAAYTGSGAYHGYGIDRGHLARSADRDAGSLDNATTYYFSNIVPQAADNNQGPWAKLETYLGNLADNDNKEVYVIAGVAGSRGTLKDQGKITIPEYVWKVAVIMPRDQRIGNIDGLEDFEIVAVAMPNVEGIAGDGWEKYKTTVNRIEALSGYDLLALLSDNLETEAESGLKDAFLRVSQLATDGKLEDGVGNSLTSKLDAAATQLDAGKNTPAVNQLQSVLRELDAMARSRRLSEQDAETLRTSITAVIGSVSP